MKTNPTGSNIPDHQPADPPLAKQPRSGSPIRLVILLGVLAIVGGALFYDYFVAPPAVKAAYEKLHDTVLRHNEIGLRPGAKEAGKSGDKSSAPTGESGGMLYSEDIQKILGMSPTYTQKTEFYTIEHYRWWGWVPLDKNYITVLYLGDPAHRHYMTHYANSLPEDDALPGKRKEPPPVVELSSETPATVAIPGLPLGPPVAGGEKGKGGKGRPQAKGAKTEAAPKSDESSEAPEKATEASKEPEKSDEPKSPSPAAESEKEPEKEEGTKEEDKPAKESK